MVVIRLYNRVSTMRGGKIYRPGVKVTHTSIACLYFPTNMARKSPRKSFFLRMKIIFLNFLPHLLRPRSRRLEVSEDGAPITKPPDISRPLSPASSTLLQAQCESQGYHDPAQPPDKCSPSIIDWLRPRDIQLVGATPFSSGGSSDMWEGTSQGLLVAVKSIRCYSSPEFSPVDVGMVGSHQSARLGCY
jgi:hypothetical protein